MKKAATRKKATTTKKAPKKRAPKNKTPKKPAAKKTGSEDLLSARARWDKKRLQRERKTHWAHFWNVCPKCGGDMFEQKFKEIYFDVCRSCHGIFIDKAEVDLAKRFLEADKLVSALLRKAAKPKIPKF